jgi:hypothetical protein
LASYLVIALVLLFQVDAIGQTPTPDPSASGGCATTPSPSGTGKAQPTPSPSGAGCTTPAPTFTATPCPPAPTPAPSPAPTGPLDCTAIQLLSPWSQGATAAKLGDKYDGKDGAFHIVAVVSNPPPDAVVEAFYRTASGGEKTIGSLTRVVGSATFERYWDIPSIADTGAYTLKTRLFSGGKEIGSDEVAVELKHKDAAPTGPGCAAPQAGQQCTQNPAAETVAIMWPAPGGPLGFYRASDGKWRAVIDAVGSAGTTGAPPVKLKFSTSHPGIDPVFSDCLTTGVTAQNVTQNAVTISRIFRGQCELPEGVAPSRVTAVGAVAVGMPNNTATDGSVDAVSIVPYIQDPAGMSVSLRPVDPATMTAGYPSGARRRANVACLTFAVVASDHLGRPVQGVGIDAQISGPVDNVAFGPTGASAFQQASAPAEEPTSTCLPNATGTSKQGRQIVPQGDDIKQIESTLGTYVSGPAGVGFGEWRFSFFSSDSGFTRVNAWIDDPGIATEGHARAPDDDLRGDGEPHASFVAQWLEGDLKVAFANKNDTAAVWGCHRVVIRATAGGFAVPNLNVDIHVQGPDNKIEFCDVDYEQNAHPPDAGDHTRDIPPHDHVDFHEWKSGNTDCGTGPQQNCFHAEGETDEDGNLVLGFLSTIPGDTNLSAWVEGEVGNSFDRDTRSALVDTSTTNWVRRNTDTDIRILNPSAYPAAATTTHVSTSQFRVIARVDGPFAIEGVEVLLGAGTAPTSYPWKLGDMTRIGWSDTYEFIWDLNASGSSPAPKPTASSSPSPSPRASTLPTPDISDLPTPGVAGMVPGQRRADQIVGGSVVDGPYKVQVRVIGTDRGDSFPVTVNRKLDAPPDSIPESVTIVSPANGALVGWADGAIEIEGSATAGAEGVDAFYTLAGPRDGAANTVGTAWLPSPATIPCGYTDLSGIGTARQEFTVICRLPAGTDAAQVSGLSIVPWDCTVQAGCDGNPVAQPIAGTTQTMPARQGVTAGAREAGDAVRVFSCVSFPCVTLSPLETRAFEDTCVAMELRAADASGQPLNVRNVDIHAWGPTDALSFCVPEGVAASPLRPAEMNHSESRHTEVNGPFMHHAEGETDADGRLLFGVRSDDSSFQSIYAIHEFDDTTVQAWVDVLNDDVRSKDEPSRLAWIHWELPGRCLFNGPENHRPVGTEGDDVMSGSTEDDKLCPLGGADEVLAQEGNDIVLGGPGIDRLEGDPGNDELRGDEDADTVLGGTGLDQIFGGKADDVLKGEQGDDTIMGGNGNDYLKGGRGDDTLRGGAGLDICFGDLGKDTFQNCEKIRDVKPKPKKKAPPENAV